MSNTVRIFCKNNKQYKEFPPGTSLMEMLPHFQLPLAYPIVSAKVNNVSEGLRFRVFTHKDVEFLDLRDPSAMRTYVRSLCFVLYKAVEDLFPDATLYLEHLVLNGYFGKLKMGRDMEAADVAAIKDRMADIIRQDLPFQRVECHTDEAIQLFKERGMTDKVKLLESIGTIYTRYYKLGTTVDYHYGSLVPSTGFINVFDLIPYRGGLLLRIPSDTEPDKICGMVRQDKMLDAYADHIKRNRVLGVQNVGDINKAVQSGHATQLINVSEALQEKKIAQIASSITSRWEQGDPIKLILVSGPSSSGKTTFCKRLSVQLAADGLHPYPVSLDNYYVERTQTPLDEHGQYDYESIYAIDLPLLNSQMQAMLQGEEVELPYYNFTTGKREYHGEKLRLDDSMVLIMEGLHALNPNLTPQVPADKKFKIFVSALTTLALDNHNCIPATDNRLVRRIVRDYNYRGYSASETIGRGKSVYEGEKKWIYPFQEQADAIFNSAMLFELSVLRQYAEPVLGQVLPNDPTYSEAVRLLNFLRHFTPIQIKEIPPTSLIREFIGGSSFRY